MEVIGDSIPTQKSGASPPVMSHRMSWTHSYDITEEKSLPFFAFSFIYYCKNRNYNFVYLCMYLKSVDIVSAHSVYLAYKCPRHWTVTLHHPALYAVCIVMEDMHEQ